MFSLPFAVPARQLTALLFRSVLRQAQDNPARSVADAREKHIPIYSRKDKLYRKQKGWLGWGTPDERNDNEHGGGVPRQDPDCEI